MWDARMRCIAGVGVAVVFAFGPTVSDVGAEAAAEVEAEAAGEREWQPYAYVPTPLVDLRNAPGVDPYGYPLALPDQEELRALLRDRQYGLLDAQLRDLQRECEADFRKEY